MKQINAKAHIPSQLSIEYSNRDVVHIPTHSRTFQSRAFQSRTARSSRRRGQALLITVLLMVFASVLAATFVTVVALNLSQTARSGSVASAKQAALAGRNFVNDQLTNSELGERWLPDSVDVQGAPLPADVTYYYTDFERAQGWDQIDANGRRFVKFPDPRSTTAAANGSSIFLTKVTEVTVANRAQLGLSADYIGQLKVDVIGRATDNDATFSQLTFYKPTSVNGNFTGIARYVSNWNFARNRIRRFPSDPLFNASVDTTPIGTTFTDLIGTNLDIDGEGDGNPETAATPQQTAAGNWLIQSDLRLRRNNQIRLTNSLDTVKVLGDIQTSGVTSQITDDDGVTTTTIAPTAVPPASRTGLQNRVLDGASYNNDPTSTQTIRTITPARLDTPNSRWLRMTKLSDIGNGSEHGWGSNNGVYIDNATDKESVGQLIDDGSPLRRMTYRALTDFEDQRFWTRKSFPGVPSTAALTEVKTIDNASVGNNSSLVSFQSDTTSIFNNAAHRLAWSRRVINDSYVNGSFPMAQQTLIDNAPVGPSANDVMYRPSLEQRAIRGWVSREEFVPRGVLVELKGDRIVITRDDVADTDPTTTAVSPDPYDRLPNPSKTWKEADGTPIPFAYRMEIRDINNASSTRVVGAEGDIAGRYPAPGTGFNGVIFAEGNVRVRGFTRDKNITIVSMNNIYIEGGINKTGSGNVALLAKRNVVMNPTQIVTGVEGSRNNTFALGTFTAPPVAAGLDTTVFSNSATVFPLRIGDKFRFNGNGAWHTIRTIGNPTVLPLIPSATATVTFSPPTPAATTGGPVSFLSSSTSVLGEGSADTIARDVKFDGATPTGSYYFATRHSGLNKMGVNFNRQNGTTGNGTVRVTSTTAPTKLLDLVPGPTLNYDLRTIPAVGGSTANTLGALVWQFYGDDGATPPFGVALSGNREVVDPDGPGPMPPTGYAEADGLADPEWDLYVPGGNLSILARRLANITPPLVPNVPPLPVFPLDITAGSGSIPLTVSVGLYNTTSLLSFTGTPVTAIGSSFTGTVAEPELAETVINTFYTGGDIASNLYFGNASLSPINSNVAAFRRLLTAEGDLLPGYSQRDLKLDRQTLPLVASTPITVTVEATIYAQNGSWFVIPTPYLTDNYTGAPNPAAQAERQKARRYNYQFVIQGNIAENYVPTADIEVVPSTVPPIYANEVDADNIAAGAQARWVDSLSRPTAIGGTGLGTTWQSVIYERDITPYQPTVSTNLLYLPITPDITLQR